MAKITEKENYLRMARGEQPDWVPIYAFFGGPTSMAAPNLFPNFRGPEGGIDPWGVRYVTNESTGYAALPEPNNFILKDITKWYDVIKKPNVNFEDVNWELQYKRDQEAMPADYVNTAVLYGCPCSPFQDLMSFMGFNEGLTTYFLEPDSVHELYDFMVSYWEPFIKKGMEVYKPDIFYILDDSASKYAPFISPEMYREFLKPYYVRLAKTANDMGLPVQFHNCGRCEDYIDDMLDFGVKYWDPAQVQNDLVGIKQKYAGKLAIIGGWDFEVPITWPVVDEEEVRASVRRSFDTLAPGGGYAFCGMVLGAAGDETVKTVNSWIMDEAQSYGRAFYNK